MRDHNYLWNRYKEPVNKTGYLLMIQNGCVECNSYTYLLLTEFEVRTVSYGPNFFLFDLWPKREHKIVGGKSEDK